ncbi:site-specific integrase [Chloroflexota bacterium]
MKRIKRDISLCDLIDGFLFSLRAEAKSVSTIQYYKDLLTTFLHYTQDRDWTEGTNSLDTHRIRGFLSWVGSRVYDHSAGNSTIRIRRAKPQCRPRSHRGILSSQGTSA